MVTDFDRWVGENNIPPHFFSANSLRRWRRGP
jgi:hypothetical protein